MKRPCLAAFLIASALACAAQAQDAKKAEPSADKPAAGAAQDPAAKPARAPGQATDPQIIEDIFVCLAAGLTEDWKKAWFVVKEIDRKGTEVWSKQFPGAFRATRLPNGNVLAASMTSRQVAEIDRAGTIRWSVTCTGRPWAVHYR